MKLLIRHYSVAQNPLELGFFGAEAAAEQGYGWQYTYLFFRNQDEAERFGVGEEFMDSLAGSIGELNVPEWEEYLEDEERHRRGDRDHGSKATTTLGTDLGIRTRPAMIVSGPDGHPDPAGRPLAGPDRTGDRRSRRQELDAAGSPAAPRIPLKG